MQLFTNCIQKATKKTIDLSNTKNSLKCNHFLILLFLIYVLWLNSFMTGPLSYRDQSIWTGLYMIAASVMKELMGIILSTWE